MAHDIGLMMTDSHGRFRLPTDEEIEAANLTPERKERWLALKQAAIDMLDGEGLLREKQHFVENAEAGLKMARARLGSMLPKREFLDEWRASVATQKLNAR